MNCFTFKQMTNEDIPIFADEIFAILANNMRVISPTGNSYNDDHAIWSENTIPAWRAGRSQVILSFCKDTLCGYFQYSLTDTTFRMEEIQFKQEYHGSGLFAELYRYLTTIIPAETKHVDAYARKENTKSYEILKHLGLTVIGENKNGKSLHFKGEYKALLERYSVK